MSSPLIQKITDIAFGSEPKQRLRIKRTLMAANVSLICVVLQAYAWSIGYMNRDAVMMLSSAIRIHRRSCSSS